MHVTYACIYIYAHMDARLCDLYYVIYIDLYRFRYVYRYMHSTLFSTRAY